MKMPPLLAALALCAACSRPADHDGTFPESQTGTATIAPPISSPAEIADPRLPPSYEVAIATAAAERNRSKERCATQPEAVRARCEQEANAAFVEAERSIEHLRGNQQ